MSEKFEKEVQDVNNEEKVNDEVTEKESVFKKALKWGLRGLAVGAAVVAGIFIGRATNGNDDDTETGNTEESAE